MQTWQEFWGFGLAPVLFRPVMLGRPGPTALRQNAPSPTVVAQAILFLCKVAQTATE